MPVIINSEDEVEIGDDDDGDVVTMKMRMMIRMERNGVSHNERVDMRMMRKMKMRMEK